MCSEVKGRSREVVLRGTDSDPGSAEDGVRWNRSGNEPGAIWEVVGREITLTAGLVAECALSRPILLLSSPGSRSG